MDRVTLLPDGHASLAEQARHIPIHIREAVGWVENNAAREGGLKAASAAGYGRDQNLAKILVATVLQVGFIPATFAGDVAPEWQSAYQGRIGAHISQRDQLVQQLLQPWLRGVYQAT